MSELGELGAQVALELDNHVTLLCLGTYGRSLRETIRNAGLCEPCDVLAAINILEVLDLSDGLRQMMADLRVLVRAELMVPTPKPCLAALETVDGTAVAV